MLHDVILKYGGYAVSAMDVYANVFALGDGEIQQYGKDSETANLKANPIGYYKNDNEDVGHFRVFFEDTFEDTLKELQEADFSIVNGITYFGRRNLQQHASKMYAMIFDLDGVDDNKLNNFLHAASSTEYNIYPLPNYIVLSGHGLHLYYVFDRPIPLYPYIKLQLKEFKYALTEKIWNEYTSNLKDRQFQGINQGFRVVGGKTKVEGFRSQAYALWEHPYTLEQLCEYVPENARVDERKLFKERKMTLSEAKKRYPKWYEKIQTGQKNDWPEKWDIAGKVHGNNPHALYDWWLEKIKSGAALHHRYFDIMCLAIYATKCDVPYERLKADAYGLVEFMNMIAPTESFTESDVDSALECYDDRYATFPLSDIERISGISIERNKRNGRSMEQHLKIARFTRDLNNEAAGRKDWRDNNGRKSKEQEVLEWAMKYPDGKVSDCAKELGVSRPTVYKWWPEAKLRKIQCVHILLPNSDGTETEIDMTPFVRAQEQTDILNRHSRLMSYKERMERAKEKKNKSENGEKSHAGLGNHEG